MSSMRDVLYRPTELTLREGEGLRPLAQLGYKDGVLDSIRYGNGAVESMQYDAWGRRAGVSATSDAGPLASMQDFFGLDDVPRVRQRSWGTRDPLVDYYQTDLAGRVKTESLQNALPSELPAPDTDVSNDVVAKYLTSRYWSLQADVVGNWQSRGLSDGSNTLSFGEPDGANRYPTISVGSLSNATIQYDEAGNQQSVSGVDEHYAFDGSGWLRSATVSGATVDFAYDALGRRILEKDSSGGETIFVWDGDELAATGPREDASKLRVVAGIGSHSPLALVDQTGKGTTWYLHPGTDGSILAVSDQDGKFAEGYTYSAFGETHVYSPSDSSGSATASSEAINNRFLYQGQIYDPQLGLYHMRAREYQPSWGRFLSPDPMGLAGGINLYAYVGNQALTFSDPFGLCGQEVEREKPWYESLHFNARAPAWDAYMQNATAAMQDPLSSASLKALGWAIPGAAEQLAVGALNTPYRLFANSAAIANDAVALTNTLANSWEASDLALDASLRTAMMFADFGVVNAAGNAVVGQVARSAKVGIAGEAAVRASTTQAGVVARGLDGVVSAAQVEDYLVASGFSREIASGFASSFEGAITARMTETGEQFFRYTGRSGAIGNFLTKIDFDSPMAAVKALNLGPFGNPAGVRQIVFSNMPSLVFEGKIAGGSAVQTLIVDKRLFVFGLGVLF